MTKRAENFDMGAEISAATVAEDMRTAVMVAAGRREWGETLELMFWRAAQRLGITERRARAFWRREAKAITHVEYMTVMQRLQALRGRQAEGERQNAETRQAIARERAAWAGGSAGAHVEPVRSVVMEADADRNADTGGD